MPTISDINLIQGIWNATGQTNYSGISVPVYENYTYLVSGTTTIDGVQWNSGVFLVIKNDVTSGTVTSADVEKLEVRELQKITPPVDFSINPQQSLADIKKYYADLLILQYKNKPKARATVQLGCDIYTGNGLLFEFENILDIDRAKDYTLDLIGKIVGVPRNVVSDSPNVEFFNFNTYDYPEYDATVTYSKGDIVKVIDNDTITLYKSLQDDNLGNSVSDTDYWNETIIENNGFSTVGTLSNGVFKRSDMNYYDKNALSDKNYRILIKLKAIMNSVRSTWAEMDNMYYSVFGDNLYFENNKDGTITYYHNPDYFDSELWNAIIKLGYLIAPLGISYTVEEVNNG